MDQKKRYQKRHYRNAIYRPAMTSFNVVIQETDVLIHAQNDLTEVAKDAILEYRHHIECYIKDYPQFAQTLVPWRNNRPAAPIIKDMIQAGKAANVGPMAAVAGAIAQHVGQVLMRYSDEVIVENGGDIFFNVKPPLTVGIYAGTSPLSMRIGLNVSQTDHPFGICTSSGTIGHSLSLGEADAVTIFSPSCALADAAATAIANHVRTKQDIQHAIHYGKTIPGVAGIIVIIGEKIGFWGDIEVVPT